MKLVKYQLQRDPKKIKSFDLDLVSDNDLRSYGWLPFQEPARIIPKSVETKEEPKAEIEENDAPDISIPEIKAVPKKRTTRKTTTKPKQ